MQLSKEFTAYEDRVQISARENVDAASKADVVLLSIPPNQIFKLFDEPGFAQALRGKLIINVVAGVTNQQIGNLLGTSNSANTYIVSAIPTVGTQIGQSATLIEQTEETLPPHIQAHVDAIFSPLGSITLVPTAIYNRAMAVSAATHGLMTILTDALIDGGAAAGLPRQVMLDVVSHSIRGYSTMLAEGYDNATLKEAMLIPNGFTVRSILAFERKGLRSAISDTLVETVRLTE